MLEITGEDIAALNDDDLRSLVGKLCESTLRLVGLPASAVTYGGNQNAPDGGIDVRIKIDSGVAPGGFLPRTRIGFQVKKTDYRPSLIRQEMRPSNRVRKSISDLIADRGAYIIASSGSDTSDSALADRINAMRSAISDIPGHADFYLDFLDRTRLATWTQSHPGLILWVRQKIGRNLSGWQPYTSWAKSPDGAQDEYLVDEKTRLHTSISDDKGIDIVSGIDRMRNVLREARKVLRLVGLSGVGKTRLVQALFDIRIGSNALDPALAVYTDMTDNPSPQPIGMISDLLASRKRATLVIDNCAPDLHRRLTDLCQTPDSLISVVTVEYDVRDDEPEGTEVFRLEPSSTELVAKLTSRRYPEMTRLDIDKIAEFSGGNARVAFALANTLERHESVAGLRDEELFKRLFYQRQEADGALLKAAKACALLYSFEGEALVGEGAELPRIAAVAGLGVEQLFAKVTQLAQRDLVQRRGVWRAILPHAVANRLAHMALEESPTALLEEQFNTDRLMRSFSRRLGYLHESESAKRVVDRWVARGGLLAEVNKLNEVGIAIFSNIAPVSPSACLDAIEREMAGTDAQDIVSQSWKRDLISSILRSIAYDSSLFDRSVAVMIVFALAEPVDDRIHPVRGAIEGLFHLYLSGTHATVDQRTRIVRELVLSTNIERRALGLVLLEALLKCDHFSATHSFEFGSRVRDHGYWPSSRRDTAHWFVAVLKLLRELIGVDSEVRSASRGFVARSLRGLWREGPEVQEELETIAGALNAEAYWEEGWVAARSALAQSNPHLDIEFRDRLRELERKLRPRNIVERVRAAVLTEGWGPLDELGLDSDVGVEQPRHLSVYERQNAAATDLGRLVVDDESALTALMPDLLCANRGRLVPFGRGLAIASVQPRRVWKTLTEVLASIDERKRNVSVLAGFLIELYRIDDALAEVILEDAVTNAILSRWYPALQTSVPLSQAGAKRMKRAISLGQAPLSAYRSLAHGRATGGLSGEDLRDILAAISSREGGYMVAMEILAMRLHADKDESRDTAPELLEFGRELLAHPQFSESNTMDDYHLNWVVEVCLRGSEGSAAAQSFCREIRRHLKEYTFHAFQHEQLLKCIFELQPRIALNVFIDPQSDDIDFSVDDFDGPGDHRVNPLDGVAEDIVIAWCDEMPDERYTAISRVIRYQRSNEDNSVAWTSLALQILTRAPDPLSILRVFVGRFTPSGWSGSRASIVESRLQLLESLDEIGNPSITRYAELIRPELLAEIAKMRKWENAHDRDRDERFE